MEYEEMLKRAREKMPKTQSRERFEIPGADVFTSKQTFVRNFSDVAKDLRRDTKHLMKFLFKELAVPGSMRGNELILQGKISALSINQKIEDYVKEYVLCHECGKPDTNMAEEGKIITVKCEACGARRTGKKL